MQLVCRLLVEAYTPKLIVWTCPWNSKGSFFVGAYGFTPPPPVAVAVAPAFAPAGSAW